MKAYKLALLFTLIFFWVPGLFWYYRHPALTVITLAAFWLMVVVMIAWTIIGLAVILSRPRKHRLGKPSRRIDVLPNGWNKNI